jgi:hypothetical protein
MKKVELNKIEWTNGKRKLSQLKEWDKNPRKWEDKNIQDLDKSLTKFNLASPIVINTDNIVVGGHFRINRLKEMNKEDIEVDVRVPNRKLTDEEVEELNLRLNKNVGEWNVDILKGFDINLLKDVGFEKNYLDQISSLTGYEKVVDMADEKEFLSMSVEFKDEAQKEKFIRLVKLNSPFQVVSGEDLKIDVLEIRPDDHKDFNHFKISFKFKDNKQKTKFFKLIDKFGGIGYNVDDKIDTFLDKMFKKEFKDE